MNKVNEVYIVLFFLLFIIIHQGSVGVAEIIMLLNADEISVIKL